MGISPWRTRPCTHRREQELRSSSGCTAAWDSLGKNVCFYLWGKDNLVQLPEEPSGTWTVDAVCFSGEVAEFLECVFWWTFYKQGPVRRWGCASFDTERWSGPSYKRSRSWFRTADGKWNAIKWMCLLVIALKCSSLFSSAHSVPPPGARLFLSFFYKYVKTKDFLEMWRMQYYSIGTQD